MAKKKVKKDIMQDLLGGPDFDTIPGLEELNNLMRLCAEPPDLPTLENPLESRQPNESTYTFEEDYPQQPWKDNIKKRVTLLISEKNLVDLDDVKKRLRHMIEDPGLRISKSMIIDHAVNYLLKDFDKKGERSSLARRLLYESGKL